MAVVPEEDLKAREDARGFMKTMLASEEDESGRVLPITREYLDVIDKKACALSPATLGRVYHANSYAYGCLA